LCKIAFALRISTVDRKDFEIFDLEHLGSYKPWEVVALPILVSSGKSPRIEGVRDCGSKDENDMGKSTPDLLCRVQKPLSMVMVGAGW